LKEIVSIRDGVGSAVDTWFPDNNSLKVGNELGTLFWVDWWVGEVPLQVCFVGCLIFQKKKNH